VESVHSNPIVRAAAVAALDLRKSRRVGDVGCFAVVLML
jgi:precorrin-6B methylase 2